MKYKRLISSCSQASRRLLRLESAQKLQILTKVAMALAENQAVILRANAIDVKKAGASHDAAFVDRLILNKERFGDMVKGIRVVARLPDPVGRILETRAGRGGITLRKVAVPLGVILVIYEARPNVTAEAFSLAFKAGSGIVLKGGSEAMETNKAIVRILKRVLKRYDLDDVVVFIDSSDRSVVPALLSLHQLISVVIPRGGKELVQMVQKKSFIPVLSHAEGIDHIYVDESADFDMAIKVIMDAKTNRPATCNTVDTVLIHAGIADSFLPKLTAVLQKKGVTINEQFGKEFLSLRIAIKVVRGVNEALEHIAQFGSKHTEGIVASDKKTIATFVQGADAAAVMVNCSTRLHDGGIFGMGAEMGIATGKLHARGPVGLLELTTYKWVAYGKGQTRGKVTS